MPSRTVEVATAFPGKPAEHSTGSPCDTLRALGHFSHCMGGVHAPRACTMAAGTDGYENNRPSKFACARLAACQHPIATTSTCPLQQKVDNPITDFVIVVAWSPKELSPLPLLDYSCTWPPTDGKLNCNALAPVHHLTLPCF